MIGIEHDDERGRGESRANGEEGKRGERRKQEELVGELDWN